MKKNILTIALAGLAALNMTSCIEEINPQTSSVTVDMAGNAPGAVDNFVNGITSSIIGSFTYGGSSSTAIDFGYPTFMIMNDIMGQDMAPSNMNNEWYTTWYTSGTSLGAGYAYCQFPMTCFYKWINNCNQVINMVGEEPSEVNRNNAGIAYAMRAFFYMDVARQYAPRSYMVDPTAPSAVIMVTQSWSPWYVADAYHNPRATNEEIWKFIINDLDLAEKYIAGYQRKDVYTPDLSVVYGLKARAYLETGRWAEAKDYAQKAQQGYTMMTAAQFNDKNTGFNTPNSSWMFGMTYKDNDPCIIQNDADTSWGGQMINEMDPSKGLGGYGNYNGPKCIDAHLYSTIPATDFRRMCWVDPAIDEIEDEAAYMAALSEYTDYPAYVDNQGYTVTGLGVGYIPVKFRANGGVAGHSNAELGFIVAIPLMRVEEMKLIEAEAAGMLNEAEGISLLTAFAKTRDPQFTYGGHNEAYYNTSNSAFQNEIWWQRRVEFWGEGFARYDIKRYGKGIIRSYEGTNHPEGYRWNVETTPVWFTNCFVNTEATINYDLVNNETPVAPTEDSPEYVW